MTWINTIPYSASEGRLRHLYDRVKGPDDNIDNIMMAHSLRPHTMDGHMAIYKNVLHHSSNTVPKHFLETLGVLVSHINKCSYCVEHHFAGLRRLLNDDARADAIQIALESRIFSDAFDAKHQAALNYAAKLTEHAATVSKADIAIMRDSGFDDGQILEINQVIAYFAYANRTVLGLGINTDGDILGLSPNNSDNPDDWNHK
jgi:uncharacterized peroxidase-related enzyme